MTFAHTFNTFAAISTKKNIVVICFIFRILIMCSTCGCGEDDNGTTITVPGEEHEHIHIDSDGTVHTHSHSHGDEHHNHHEHSHSHGDGHNHQHEHSHRTISLEQDVLGKNNLLAERNRGWFDAKNIFALNLVSSPGSGKTSLLEKTITDMGKDLNCYIIEGDQQTMNDAERIKAVGAPVIQINTGNGCHLDSNMVSLAAKKLNPSDNSILFIENVGNLVCPSLFDLGESKRVVIISTTEGEDKPLKYPTMFESSDICIINKTDLLPYVDFNVEKCKEYALRVNHHLEFFELSVRTGEGMDLWYNWLKENTK